MDLVNDKGLELGTVANNVTIIGVRMGYINGSEIVWFWMQSEKKRRLTEREAVFYLKKK